MVSQRDSLCASDDGGFHLQTLGLYVIQFGFNDIFCYTLSQAKFNFSLQKGPLQMH